MAPSLPKSPTASETPRNPSGLLLGGLAPVAPVVIMILLLLLCFPFKRKKRQLSTRDPTRDSNTSELLSMIKLEDVPSLEGKSLENGDLSKGNSLPTCQPERPTNGTAAPKFQEESANSPTATHAMIRTPQRFAQRRKVEVDHLRGAAPQGRSPRGASPNALQCRKLPLTPKEAHVSRTEPLNMNMDTDNGVYESICDEERDQGTRVCMEGRKPADSPTNGNPNAAGGLGPSSESLDSVGKGGRTLACEGTPGQPAAGRPSIDLPGLLAGTALEAPTQVALDAEKRLSAMYARVRKRPKAAGQEESPKDGRTSQREEEDEPPPIPEKRFEDLYESLSIDEEMQGGVTAGVAVSLEA